jgi:hypothetical protein
LVASHHRQAFVREHLVAGHRWQAFQTTTSLSP